MASETRYVDRPGGVFVHVQDETGTPIGTQHVKYGEPLPENMTPAQAKVADSFSTTDAPKPESEVRADVAARAQEKAALDEGGQVGSSSSPIPGNYSELDEAGAARFVASLKGSPRDQAAVIVYEKTHGNRRAVLDAASDEAKEIASVMELAPTHGGSGPTPQGSPDVSGLEQTVEELRAEIEALKRGETAGQAPEVDPEDYTEAELRDMAEKAGVENVKSGDNKAEIAAKINAHNAARAATGPTPSSPEG